MLRISLLLCIIPAFGIIVRDPPPTPNDYKYSYDIQDAITGDRKSQYEVRRGDIVTGAYTVVGPDGTKRTVEYTADAKRGFNAVISEEPSQRLPVTPPPIIKHHIPYYNTVQYHSSESVYQPDQIRPRINYIDHHPIYFTPQNKIDPRLPLANGHYFLPAHK